MPQQSHSMLKSKHLEHSSEEKEIELFSYIDLLNYMLKYKIPQIVTLTPLWGIVWTITKKEEYSFEFPLLCGWQMGLEPTTFRTTI